MTQSILPVSGLLVGPCHAPGVTPAVMSTGRFFPLADARLAKREDKFCSSPLPPPSSSSSSSSSSPPFPPNLPSRLSKRQAHRRRRLSASTQPLPPPRTPFSFPRAARAEWTGPRFWHAKCGSTASDVTGCFPSANSHYLCSRDVKFPNKTGGEFAGLPESFLGV